MNMNDALYRNNPPYVNMNLYHGRNSLNKRDLERLLGQLRRYRNEYRLAGSRVVSNTIKNLEKSLLLLARSGSRRITRENLLKARSRLKHVPSPHTIYRKAPFSASNLQKAKAKLRPTSYTKSSQKLANLTLRKLIESGRGANVPWHMVPTGSLRKSLSKPRITRANLGVGQKNMNIVRNFKYYLNENTVNYFATKYGLTPEQNLRLYRTVLNIQFPEPGTNRRLVELHKKYMKKGSFTARDVWRILKEVLEQK